ncbi:metal-response element-binding transcription factor 2-like isoform X8 [Leptotrombidium deliense]|uniref:Metal-response element-binding transcription factor 2-like isoform X8 n=1 Tax=Leptotrombidium deliense TaxID=299467 RepID=A0A443SCH4_9ACAR|nr:metal-response element-binding transcription factor 2-like isoform X8 [Leptotrombidium deliense]
MLQCHHCLQWFHGECIQSLNVPLLYGDNYYLFVCSICNNGKEYLRRFVMDWCDMLGIVLHNLSRLHNRWYFDLKSEIIPFIKNNRKSLNVNVNLENISHYYKDLLQKLSSNKDMFVSINKNGEGVLWAVKLQSERKGFLFGPPYTPAKYCSTITTYSEYQRILSYCENFHIKKNMKSRGMQTISRPVVSELSSVETLDEIIPPPINFEGENNPFFQFEQQSGKTYKNYQVIKSPENLKVTVRVVKPENTAQSNSENSSTLKSYTLLGCRRTKTGKKQCLVAWN